MTLYDKISAVLKMKGQSAQAGRICAQLNFAASLSTAKKNGYDSLVESVADYLLAKSEDEGGVITASAAAEAEKMLLPLSDAAKSYRVHCVSHAHIDMNWMWGFQETASIAVDTFRTVLDIMKEYPEFTFAQSQASTYKIIEDYAPEMLDEIRQRVKEGRWELSASTWVENDQNMASGESLARHILYTKKYLGRLFDVPADSLQLNFQPDTFGHNASVPEICSKGGVKYYYHCRGNEDHDFTYVWRAESGAELLVWYEPYWYISTIEPDMFAEVPQHCEKYGINCFLRVYGVGDHGGGPTRRDVARIIEMSSWPVMPTILFSTYGNFFAELEAFRGKLPVRNGELNYIFTGCYTSQSDTKMANRIGEDRLYESELLSASANVLAGASKYNPQYEKAWQNVLFNQFHDILPGSGVADTRNYALGQFQQAMAAAGTGANLAMRALAAKIDTSAVIEEDDIYSVAEGAGVGYSVDYSSHYAFPTAERGNGKKRVFHFFNPTQYDFDGVTVLTVWDWNYDIGRAFFTTPDGTETEHKIISKNAEYWQHYFSRFALKIKVPAFGYATYILDEKETESNNVGPTNGHVQVFRDDDIVLENNKIKAVFCHRTLQLVSLLNKETGTEFVSTPCASFRFITEYASHGGTAWHVGEYMTVVNINEVQNVYLRTTDTEGIRKTITYDVGFGTRSKLEVTVVLEDNSPTLAFECRCDFQETGDGHKATVPQLAFHVPVSYPVKNYKYDIPFALITRPELNQDVPASTFGVALNENGGDCLMLVSDSKYGFRGTKNSISLDLIRGSYDPDPYPEYGVHYFRLGVSVCSSDEAAVLYENSSRFIHPCSVCSARKGEGTLAMSGSLFSVSENVRVTSVKNPECGSGLVIRLHNITAAPSEFSVTFGKKPVSVSETDVNERKSGALNLCGNTVSAEIGPFEVKTILAEYAD